MQFDAGSFRDPAGRVILHEGRIFRALFEPGFAAYKAASEANVHTEMAERGLLLSATPTLPEAIDPKLLALAPKAKTWLEHPRLDFVSYPYEWCFSGLQAAAIVHLDLHLALLERGFTLSDATAYNVQFRGTRPVFIDHLSIVPYVEGSPWNGQRQFGMQFLNPLYLWAKKKVAPHAWYRGSVEGIEPEELVKLLGIRDRLSFTVLAHILGPAAFAQRRVVGGLNTQPRRKVTLTKLRLIALLTGLRDYIAELKTPFAKTVWGDYAGNNSYDPAQRDAKHHFVAEAVNAFRPHRLWDIGCNSGDFSQTAMSAGAGMVVGFDFDFGALEQAFSRFGASGAPVLPIWLDASNPSPSQGWAEAERKSLQARANADMVLALAVIHHLAIGRNVPLDLAVDWLMGLAPTGVVEFPSKEDPMVQHLLRDREDIFPDYTEDNFLDLVAARGQITQKARLGENGRLIVAYDRRT